MPVCREEEGIGICAGAYLVGKKCAAIMQNGGFFNSNNAIVSTLLQYQIPLLLLIYYAGDVGDRTFSTTGSLTEPVLQALGIRYYVMRETEDAAELIRRAQVLTRRRETPGGAAADQGVARPPCRAQSALSEENFSTWIREAMQRFDCLESRLPRCRRCARRQLGRGGDPRVECAAAEGRQLSRAHAGALFLDRSRHGAGLAASAKSSRSTAMARC